MVAICPRCGKEIEPVRKVGWQWFALWLLVGIIPALIWRWFTLWLLFGMIPALIYVFYHFTKVPKNCPICGYRNVYDEGKQLREDEIKYKTKELKKRFLDLDYKLERRSFTQTEKEKFASEAHEVAEELRKYGYKGAVRKRFKEKKY